MPLFLLTVILCEIFTAANVEEFCEVDAQGRTPHQSQPASCMLSVRRALVPAVMTNVATPAPTLATAVPPGAAWPVYQHTRLPPVDTVSADTVPPLVDGYSSESEVVVKPYSIEVEPRSKSTQNEVEVKPVSSGQGPAILPKSEPISVRRVRDEQAVPISDEQAVPMSDEEASQPVNTTSGNIYDVFMADFRMAYNVLLPGLVFRSDMLPMTALIILLSAFWFHFFYEYIYTNDRTESLELWQDRLDSMRDTDFECVTTNVHGDITLEFYHPKGVDPELSISTSSIRTVLKSMEHSDFAKIHFPKVYAFALGHHEESRSYSPGSFMREHSWTPRSSGDPATHPNLADVRVALFEDVCSCLTSMGFDLRVFSANDNETVFVCASLVDPEVTKLYLDRDNIAVQLHRDVAAKLGISQPVGSAAASPPFVPYDSRVEQRLLAAGVFKTVEESQNCYHRHKLHDEYGFKGHGTRWEPKQADSFAGSISRIRILMKEMEAHFNMDAAKSIGLIADWFTSHNPLQLHQLWAIWGDPRLVVANHFVQPINQVFHYFGTVFAFQFAWMGCYIKSFLALLPPTIYAIWLMIKSHFSTEGDVIPESRQLLAYALVLVVWSRVSWNMWLREQDFFRSSWEVNAEEAHEIPCSGYHGDVVPSQIDSNIPNLEYPAHLKRLRRCASNCALAACCLGVAFVIWIQKRILSGTLTWWQSILLTVQIEAFELLFNVVCLHLTNFENHKWLADYYNSYLIKQAVFQCVNNYYPFLYIVLWQAHDVIMVTGRGGLNKLADELTMAQFVLTLGRVGHVFASLLKVRFHHWYKLHKLEKQGNLHTERIVQSFVEMQSELVTIGTKEQVWIMLHPVISLGHVFIFGSAAPTVVPLGLTLFVFQRICIAFLLTNYAKRPFPLVTEGIGAWEDIILLLMKFGVVTSGFLVVVFGQAFQGTVVLARSSGLVCFCAVACIIWNAVDYVLPQTDPETTLLVARRRYVERSVMHSGQKPAEMHEDEIPRGRCYPEGVLNGDWTTIKPFAPSTLEPISSSRTRQAVNTSDTTSALLNVLF